MGLLHAYVLTTLLGVCFYVVRCRWQLVYGALEIFAALVIIFVTFYPQTNHLLLAEASWQSWFLRTGVGALAGMYVMVRGLLTSKKDFHHNGTADGGVCSMVIGPINDD